MEFASIATGSSGNCNIVRSDNTTLVVDMGLPWNRTNSGLKHFDVDNVDAFFVTHEHIDHIGGLDVVSRQIDAPIYTTRGTNQGIGERKGETGADLRLVHNGAKIGDISVIPISTFHDTYEPNGYIFECGDERLTLITDTGKIDDGILDVICDSDAVMLEADYEDSILREGMYAQNLKERILSEHGHLSNDDAAQILLTAVEKGRLKKALLIHGSQNTNTPLTAYKKVRDKLMSKGYWLDIDLMLAVADREVPSSIIKVK